MVNNLLMSLGRPLQCAVVIPGASPRTKDGTVWYGMVWYGSRYYHSCLSSSRVLLGNSMVVLHYHEHTYIYMVVVKVRKQTVFSAAIVFLRLPTRSITIIVVVAAPDDVDENCGYVPPVSGSRHECMVEQIHSTITEPTSSGGACISNIISFTILLVDDKRKVVQKLSARSSLASDIPESGGDR